MSGTKVTERDRLTERVAELVTEGNELRALVDEILDVTFDPDSPGATLQQIAEWRKHGQRAGLAPAVAFAGTEHLAAEITRLVIPDEEG